MSPHLAQFDLTGHSTTASWSGAAASPACPFLSRRRRAASWAAHSARSMAPSSPACCGPRRWRLAVDPGAVLILFDTGGVRLQEANAGELAIAEIIRAIFEAPQRRHPGGRPDWRPGWTSGGGGMIAACCSRIAVSEHARMGVSGPEVIETNKGVEEFDFKDRALRLARLFRARTRYLTGGVVHL